MPATGSAGIPTVGAASSGYDPAEEAEREHRVKALEERLDAAERANAENDAKLSWLKKLTISGYAQPQLLIQVFNASASPNNGATGLPAGIGSNDVTAKPVDGFSGVPGVGATTNGDFFRLRRTRLRTEFEPTDYARFVLEFEPFPAGGPIGGIGTMARNVESVGIVHWTRDVTTEFAMGEFKIPFGYEVLQSDAERPFIERSWGERNMTPAEFDIGARAYTSALDKKLGVQVAVINGHMLGERTFQVLPDLNKGKDVLGRANWNFGPVDVGASGYYGQGELVDAVGLRFKQYVRWAGNLEAAVHHTFMKKLGMTRVFAEATLGRNMDRGVNYSIGLPTIPNDVVNGSVEDLDERSTWLRIEQDITEWFTFGLRYDFYTPNSAQKNDGRDTYGAVAVVHFTQGLQFMLEADHAIDNVHKPGAQAPSKQIESVSSVLQVRF